MSDITRNVVSLDTRSASLASQTPPGALRGLSRYLLMATAVLAPGALAHQQWHLLGPAFGWLEVAMLDIHFGGGLRFWCGVAGAMLMALLLLYPLRKQFLSGRSWGSVGFWYHSHIVLGLLGPVLIAYHTDFGLGAFNSNAALYSMLAVVVSGGAGYLLMSRFKLWRLLHLPVFTVTVVATLAHVVSVWGGVEARHTAMQDDPLAIEQSLPDTQVPEANAPMAQAVTPDRVPMPSAAKRPAAVKVQPATVRRQTVELSQQKGHVEGKTAGGLKIAKAIATPPPPAPKPPERSAIAEQAAVVTGDTKAQATPKTPAAEPSRPLDRLTQLFQIARVNDFSTISLTDVLAELKQARFDHNKTGFRLTGAHVRTACAKCHIEQLKDTPTACIACHQKDDVHRGRRPQCGRCHSTSRW